MRIRDTECYMRVKELSSYQLETLYRASTTMLNDHGMGACRCYLRHHQPRLRRNNGSRSYSIIDHTSATATAWGALASSTLSPPQRQLEGLWHHRGSRGSGIIDPPLPQQRLKWLRHHRPVSAAIMARGVPASSTSLCRSNGSKSSGIIDLTFATATVRGALLLPLTSPTLPRSQCRQNLFQTWARLPS
jgi:hypothetical protein